MKLKVNGHAVRESLPQTKMYAAEAGQNATGRLGGSCVAIGTLVLLVGFPTPAEAYLDPGTGSIVLQVVAGGVLAAIATTKLYWKRIRSMFARGQADEAAPSAPTSLDNR